MLLLCLRLLTLLRSFGRSSTRVLVDHIHMGWNIGYLECDAAVLGTAVGFEGLTPLLIK